MTQLVAFPTTTYLSGNSPPETTGLKVRVRVGRGAWTLEHDGHAVDWKVQWIAKAAGQACADECPLVDGWVTVEMDHCLTGEVLYVLDLVKGLSVVATLCPGVEVPIKSPTGQSHGWVVFTPLSAIQPLATSPAAAGNTGAEVKTAVKRRSPWEIVWAVIEWVDMLLISTGKLLFIGMLIFIFTIGTVVSVLLITGNLKTKQPKPEPPITSDESSARIAIIGGPGYALTLPSGVAQSSLP
jgi:hypothetical protein